MRVLHLLGHSGLGRSLWASFVVSKVANPGDMRQSCAMKPRLKHRWSLQQNPLMGLTFGRWLRLLADNRFHISPAYLHRALVITLVSPFNSLNAFIEDRRFGKAIAATQITQPPVFILGHWRSGTTHLHDLLAHDDALFHAPNTFQVTNPLTFLTTEATVSKLFAWLLPAKRPMDNMPLKFTSAQEDEFAPMLMSLKASYLAVSFPHTGAHYEDDLTFANVPPARVTAWKDAFVTFCKKLTLNDPRALLLKSPPHTARIKTILEMFPDARFVHIHRDPYRVFQSHRNFFDTACWYMYMQTPNLDRIDDDILTRHTTMYDAFFVDLTLIPEGRITHVAFDDLESQPMRELSRVYTNLNLPGFDTYAPKVQAYLDSIADYKKNSFVTLDEPTKAIVADRWSRSFETWGYPK